jgi:hypothetical protein
MFIWHIFSGLGIMCQEKSGNPGYIYLTLRVSRFLIYYTPGNGNAILEGKCEKAETFFINLLQ